MTIPVYVNIYDLQPIEPLFDIDDTNIEGFDGGKWTVQQLIDDIREHGIKHQLKVDKHGNILNGNGRYWCARFLLEKEHDQRFVYLPIEYDRMGGAIMLKTIVQPSVMEASAEFMKILARKHDVIPSKTQFEEYPISKTNPKALERGIVRGKVAWKMFNHMIDHIYHIIFIADDDVNE